MDIYATFKKYEDEYLKYDKLHTCSADLNAFVLLRNLCPSNKNIISAANRDKIYLEVSPEDLSKVASEEDIITLVQCGVIIDEEEECLFMSV